MSNKLKEIFSDQQPQYSLNVNFKDAEQRKAFVESIKKVSDVGEPVAVDGLYTIDAKVKDGNIALPIHESMNVTDMMIYPDKENFEIETSLDSGEIINLYMQRYRITEGVVVVLNHKDILDIKLTHRENDFTLNYNLHPEKADSIGQIIDAYKQLVAFFKIVFTKEKKNLYENSQKQIVQIKEMVTATERVLQIYQHLEKLNEDLNLEITPQDLGDDVYDIEELYAVLYEKRIFRACGKLNDFTPELKLLPDAEPEVTIGKKLELIGISKSIFAICKKNIDLYFVKVFMKAVVKDIIDKKNNIKKLVLGSDDSDPMFMAYSVYRTEEDAKRGLEDVQNRKEEYMNAITIDEYVNVRDK